MIIIFIIKSYTCNTKITFSFGTFYKKFSFKMFPKCSPDVPNIATLREHSADISGILRAGWVVVSKDLQLHCTIS